MNSMQLKAIINNLAKSKNISAQIIMQNYMLERLLERISLSRYKPNFILKGGLLIASIVGLDTRATMDMDATLQGVPVNVNTITHMFEEICHLQIADNVTFSIVHTEEIRDADNYAGLRISLNAQFLPMVVPLKIDITTGDKITPKEIIYQYKLLLESRSIEVLAYNIETILAEKLETVISRSDQNTRLKDYYDIYIIHQLQWENVNIESLRKAIAETAKHRNSFLILETYNEILQRVAQSDAMNDYWKNYQAQFDYAQNISFIDICETIRGIYNLLLSSE